MTFAMKSMLLIALCVGLVSAAALPPQFDRNGRRNPQEAGCRRAQQGWRTAAILKQLGDSGSKLVRDVLTAWPRDQVILVDAADGSKVPACWKKNKMPKEKSAPRA